MRHYLFTEETSGEEFIVGADMYNDAFLIACDVAAAIEEEYGEEPFLRYRGVLTDEEAEMSGLDEY